MKMSEIILDELLKDYSIEKVYWCSDEVSCAGFTPLMIIVMNTGKYPELNDQIKNYVHMINNTNNYGCSALILSYIHNNTFSSIETIRFLLKYGADVNMQDVGSTVLMYATRFNNNTTELIQLLLDHGANINAKNNDGYNALMVGCKYSPVETIQLLLEHGANVNEKVNDGWTAFMLAVKYNNITTIQLLLKHGANVNEKNLEGWTPLMFAVKYSNITTVKLLLDHGADVNMKTDEGLIALIIANDYKSIDTIKLIVQYHDLNTIKMFLLNDSLNIRKVCLDELEQRLKLEKVKIINYVTVLKNIPEQDARIRFKLGNMGYQISMLGYGGDISDKLLDYLSATMDNIHEKAEEFLSFN